MAPPIVSGATAWLSKNTTLCLACFWPSAASLESSSPSWLCSKRQLRPSAASTPCRNSRSLSRYCVVEFEAYVHDTSESCSVIAANSPNEEHLTLARSIVEFFCHRPAVISRSNSAEAASVLGVQTGALPALTLACSASSRRRCCKNSSGALRMDKLSGMNAGSCSKLLVESRRKRSGGQTYESHGSVSDTDAASS